MKPYKENNQLYLFDQQYYQLKNIKYLAGTDEAGRGSLAGPIVTAAVILPFGYYNPLINDSKKLSAQLRQRLYFEIIEKAVAYSLCEIDFQTIEKINPKKASQLGMQQAILNLKVKPNFVLTDFEKININIDFEPIEKGDLKSQTIAAASIIAKYTRDKIMENLHQAYPLYDFAQNKGYGTANHLTALNLYGPCAIHRKTYAPVQLAFLQFNNDK